MYVGKELTSNPASLEPGIKTLLIPEDWYCLFSERMEWQAPCRIKYSDMKYLMIKTSTQCCKCTKQTIRNELSKVITEQD